MDSLSLLFILESVIDFVEGSNCDLSDVVLEVLSFESLDRLEHVEGSVVEVLLQVELLVRQEVDEGSLLYVVVLSVDSHVFHLLFGRTQVGQLLLLSHVSPH